MNLLARHHGVELWTNCIASVEGRCNLKDLSLRPRNEISNIKHFPNEIQIAKLSVIGYCGISIYPINKPV